VKDRQSSRQCIELTLHRSERAFLSALTMASGTGRVEEVRQACLSLALLRAFQTSLGQGSPIVTASAAGILGTSGCHTELHRAYIQNSQLRAPPSLCNERCWRQLMANSWRSVTMIWSGQGLSRGLLPSPKRRAVRDRPFSMERARILLMRSPTPKVSEPFARTGRQYERSMPPTAL